MKRAFRVAAAALAAWAGLSQAAEPVFIGQSLPLQGADVDGRGEQVLAGARALVESLNARGGIGGRELRLVSLNNQGDLQLHRRNLRELVQRHKAVAWINCLGDAQCAVAAEEARAQRIALVGVHAGLAELQRATHRHVFRVRPGYAREAEALARQLGALNVDHVVLVCSLAQDSRDEEPVQAVMQALARAAIASTALRLGREPGSEEPLLRQLASGGHRTAVLLLNAADIARLVDASADRRPEWPANLYTLSNGALNLLWGSFPQRAIGYTMVMPNPDRGALALTRELQRASEIAGGPLATSASGLEAYISARLVAEAVRRAGPRATRESVYEALDSLGDVDLGGLVVRTEMGRASASDFIDLAMRPRLAAR